MTKKEFSTFLKSKKVHDTLAPVAELEENFALARRALRQIAKAKSLDKAQEIAALTLGILG